MRALLLVVIAAVMVAGGVRLIRLRGDAHAAALSRAMAGESVYVAAMLGFLAYHADWLPWHRVIVFAGMTVIGALLLRVVLIATAMGTPRTGRLRPSPGLAGWYVAGLTAIIVLPVVLTKPAPQPPSSTEAAAATFGGHINGVLRPAETSVVEQSGPPRVADAKVDRGEAVPVEQFLVDGRQLALVVAHHPQCVPRVVVLTHNGDRAAVAVVAAPAPNADALFPQPTASALPSEPTASAGVGRCAPDGPFTWRTVVNVSVTRTVTGITDAGAGGPAAPVTGP